MVEFDEDAVGIEVVGDGCGGLGEDVLFELRDDALAVALCRYEILYFARV